MASKLGALIRLNKLMSQQGLCSRREADAFITQGLVQVNGQIVDTVGEKVDEQSNIVLLKAAEQQQASQKTVLLHKPLGIVSSQPESSDHVPAIRLLTSDKQFRPHEKARFHSNPCKLPGWAVCGRLDVHSTGLLVLSQSGRIAKQLIGPASIIEKEYLVRLTAKPNQIGIASLIDGIEDNGELLRAKMVDIVNDQQVRFVLTQGKHHQIRRMCAAVEWHVQALKRVRVGSIVLGDLPLGHWRYLRSDESFLL